VLDLKKKKDHFGHTFITQERAEPAANCKKAGNQPEYGEEVR